MLIELNLSTVLSVSVSRDVLASLVFTAPAPVVSCWTVLYLFLSFLQAHVDGVGDTNRDAKNGEDWEEVGEDVSV